MEPAPDVVTEDEYLARERDALDKHEYRAGRIVAMAGGSPRHNVITANVCATLRALLAGRCVAFSSDQRVFIPVTGGLYTYPDVTVACGPEFHPRHGDTLTNPRLIVEVLSRSTEAYDRGEKFVHYRTVPSLTEYLLVSQRERRVEHYRRVEVGRWELTEAVGDGTLALPALGVTLPLVEVYAQADEVPGDD